MNHNEGILATWHLLGNGQAKKVEHDIASEVLSNKKLTWIHLDANIENTKSWLSDNISCLDDIIIEALLEKETNPRLLEFSKGILIILRVLNTIPGEDIEDMISVRIWIDQHRIISVERRHSNFLEQFESLFHEHKAPKSSGDFVSFLNHLVLKSSDPLVQSLEDEIDETEELFIDDPTQSITTQILQTRKKALILKRYFSPQRQVIFNLRALNIDWLNTRHKRILHEQYERMQRIIENLDLIRERSQIISDEANNAAAARMSLNLYILSIITSIFLPLSFLTGLFGINVGGIPWQTHSLGFWFFCGFLLVMVIGTILTFKYKKWV